MPLSVLLFWHALPSALPTQQRHLGTVQMTTDTAMGVTKRVVEDGLHMKLEKKMVNAKTRRKVKVWLGWISLSSSLGVENLWVMPFNFILVERSSIDILKLWPSDLCVPFLLFLYSGSSSNVFRLSLNETQKVEMPFRYMAEDPSAKVLRPLMPKGMRELIRSDLDRAFEF